MKVGRNDLCPCGSGRKLKKCHLAMPTVRLIRHADRSAPAMPPHIREQIEEHRLQEEARVATFGEIRPIIHITEPIYSWHRHSRSALLPILSTPRFVLLG